MNHLQLEKIINQQLSIQHFKDYCPNGLQVQGKSEVKKILSGVTACHALLEAAIEHQADAILVHHGYFWKNENPSITGIKYQRIAKLIQHQLNLYAYHLPLDCHPQLGNNVQLAQQLGISKLTPQSIADTEGLVYMGEFANPLSPEIFSQRCVQQLHRQPLLAGNLTAPIKTIAWCTGGGQGFIESAYELGVDAYLTGEVSEQTVHIAREWNRLFIAAGHHATERYGVKALGEYLAQEYGLEHVFVDIDNPA